MGPSAGRIDDFPRLWQAHALNCLSVFIIVRQDVVDLTVLELAHVVLDGITNARGTRTVGRRTSVERLDRWGHRM